MIILVRPRLDGGYGRGTDRSDGADFGCRIGLGVGPVPIRSWVFHVLQFGLGCRTGFTFFVWCSWRVVTPVRLEGSNSCSVGAGLEESEWRRGNERFLSKEVEDL